MKELRIIQCKKKKISVGKLQSNNFWVMTFTG